MSTDPKQIKYTKETDYVDNPTLPLWAKGNA